MEAASGDPSSPARQEGNGWRRLRLMLGLLQMFGAVVSLTLLAATGVTAIALGAVALTSLMTTISVVLFGGRHPKQVPHPQRTSRV